MTTVGIVTPITKNEMNELLKETKETLATGITQPSKSNQRFGAIDLWKLRKNTRTSLSLRRHF